MTGTIACFGELLLRLTAPGRELLLQTGRLDVHVGGAEANVAVGLARLGHRTRMISRVPANDLGEAAGGYLRRYGVDAGGVSTGPGRMGLYFLSPGAGLRASAIVYDREASSFAQAKVADFDLDRLLDGVDLLHMSGITPALGPDSAELAVATAEAARAKGIAISFDGNYRAQLWQRWDSDPRTILTRLVGMAEIFFGNHRDISLLLGSPFSGEGEERRREAAEAAFGAFPSLRMIASTARHVTDADTHRISARIDSRDGVAQTEEVTVAGIVDRIGAGDAFAAGVLHGLRSGRDLDWTVGSGLALTALKHSLSGDASLFGPSEIDAFLSGESMSGGDFAVSRRILLAGAAAAAVTPLKAAPAAPVVTTTSGPLRGVREAGLSVFRGIRYGRDTRSRRFQAPLPPPPSREIVDAVRFGPSCPQKNDRYSETDEDCLFLNVWTPEARPGGRRPVMLYIHGGAYSTGSVVDPLNDGRHLAAAHDVVVVTVNHRLNAFGYLYLARLDPRFADSGNVGQLDLLLALQWVRDNIAAFGGDPKRVMVFGQSGGGAKIATMMGMPAAKGLFQRATTMSGQQVTASGPINATARARAYLAAAKADLSDLLTLPTARLVDALAATDPILGGGVYMGPVLDMKWLTRHPFWPDANPQSNAIPMMLGNTHDETRAFIDPEGPKLAGIGWDNVAERMAPELKVDILPEWVVSQYRQHFPSYSPEQVFYAATTAGRSWRGQVIEADARAEARAPTWVYQVDFQSPTQPRRGAPHTMDIALSFGTIDAPGSFTGTGPEARRLSATVMAAFANFARTGNPNGAGVPRWPGYTLPSRDTMLFDAVSHAVADPRKWQRELFARVPYIQPGS